VKCLRRFLHRASLNPADAESALKSGSSIAAAIDHAAAAQQQPDESMAGQVTKHEQSTDASTARLAPLRLQQLRHERLGMGSPHWAAPGQSGQAAQIPSWNLSERLDFAEFLQRQQSHLQVKVFELLSLLQGFSLPYSEKLGTCHWQWQSSIARRSALSDICDIRLDMYGT